jgi:streptogramin lyase
LIALLLTVDWLAGARPVVAATAEITEGTAIATASTRIYAVQNGARNLAAEAPGKIWFTATDAGGIGVVTVIEEPNGVVRYRTEFYGLGEKSQPYDLDIAGGFVWFTVRGLRSLGRLEIATRDIQLFALPTFGSSPTGIDVAPNGQVWIAATNGRLVHFDPASETFTEHVFPAELAAAPYVEDIAFETSRFIWFTLPDANTVGVYNSVTGRFNDEPTGETSPSGLTLDSNGRLWVTALGSSRIGRYTATTVGNWFWYNTPAADTGPAGLITVETGNVREVWFAQSRTGTLGRLRIVNGFTLINRAERRLSEPAGAPWGVTRASDGHLWVADTSANLLIEVLPPFIGQQWLPTVAR